MLGVFFTDRPVFAGVIAILLVLVGAIVMAFRPIEQYPGLTPPVVIVVASYPGANAEIAEQAVTAPIEVQVNGVAGLIYMSSTTDNFGNSKIQLVFRPGYDVDIAAVDVQNKLQAAMPSLPQAVQAQGVQVLKANPALVMAIALTSKNPSFDYAYLNNLAGTLVGDAIKRLPGTGNVQQTGYPYSMRLWLNPQRLADLSITVNDIINVVKDQNNNYSTGQVGLAPSPTGQVLTIPILTKGYLSEVSEFEQLVVRSLSDGASVRIKDVARVELGAQDYTYNSRINGAPAAVLLVSQLSGANAVQLSKDVRRAMTNTARIFPEGVEWSIPVRQHEVHHGVDPGSDRDVLRGAGAGDARRVPVPRQLAQHARPDVGGAGVDHRRVHRHGRAGVHDQHADAVRHGPRDRPCRRRRHPCRGARRGIDGGRASGAARGDQARDATVDRPDRGRDGGAELRLPADGVHSRPRGQALPAVRRHDHADDAAVGADGDVADACALRAAAEAEAAGRAPRLLRRVQPRVSSASPDITSTACAMCWRGACCSSRCSA